MTWPVVLALIGIGWIFMTVGYIWGWVDRGKEEHRRAQLRPEEAALEGTVSAMRMVLRSEEGRRPRPRGKDEVLPPWETPE